MRMPITPANAAGLRSRWTELSRKTWTEDRWGWVLWAVFAVVVAANQFRATPTLENVFRVYRDAGCHWREGQPLYDGTGTGFIYLPQCALLCVPLSFLSFCWAGVAWRILNVGIFALGVWQFVRLAGRYRSPTMFPLVSLIVILLSWSAARHGQMTMTMGGLMLLAVAELVDRRWWRAALYMTVGLAIKPLTIVLMLLAVAIYPRLWWRVLLALGVLAVLPFLAQRPEYVWQQYCDCVPMFLDASVRGPTEQFPHLFWVLSTASIEIPAASHSAIRLAAAALTLAVCWLAQKRTSAAQAGAMLYTMAVIYLLLFNPRTEHNAFCLLAVPLAVSVSQAIAARHWLMATTLFAIVVAMLASHPLGKFIHTASWKPLLCVVFLAIVMWQFWRDLRHNSIRLPSS
jgi:alpha-1,2-mannosyltransferase